MSDIQIRRATFDDYQAILDIADGYHGRDYLPGLFDKYMKLFLCVVGEIDGRIVSFLAGRLIDGGMTVMEEAGRVEHQYRGNNIVNQMSDFIINYFTHEPNTPRYLSAVTDNENMAKNGHRILRRHRVILERVVVEMMGKVVDFNPSSATQYDTDCVKHMTAEDLSTVFKSKEMCSDLFPEGRFVPNEYPYRLMEENIPLMLLDSVFWGTKSNNGQNFTVITAAEFYVADDCLTYGICIFGYDLKNIRKHVYKHMKIIKSLLKHQRVSSIMISLRHPLNCQQPAEFLSIFEDCGITISEDFPVDRLIVLEKPIIKSVL